MELYVHYPFCVRKCNYCDFLSSPASGELREQYMTALRREIAQQSQLYGHPSVETIFIGGGTPSIMTPRDLRLLLESLREDFHIEEAAEITMEANPGTLTDDLLKVMVESGINRLSLGLQSADNKELQYLGRIHFFEDFLSSYAMARKAGIKNINVDLMSALPGQTLSSWENTLTTVARLSPEHISAYSLIIEEGTPFYEMYAASMHRCGSVNIRENPDIWPLPTEDEERRMYERTEEILNAYGYERYEISNYAKLGFVCRHNLGYWQGKDYLGLGLGASSLINQVRFNNTGDFNRYMKCYYEPESSACDADVREAVHSLSLKEQMEEFMFLGLRISAGVLAQDFFEKFHRDLFEVYGDVIQKHCADGLLCYDAGEGRLWLTKRGVDVSNYVLSDFI